MTKISIKNLKGENVKDITLADNVWNVYKDVLKEEVSAKILLEDKEYVLNPGQSIDIPLKAKHSLQNPFFEDLEIIEVQLGNKLIEEDINRFHDIYGRENK